MLYKVAVFLLSVIFRVFGLKVENQENAKHPGPYIVAANHVSNWDAVFVAIAVRPPIHFMSKVELFKVPVLSFIVRRLHAFPVERGKADKKAIRTALSLLEKGKVVGIFPEGIRNKSGEEIKAHSGVALLALKAGVPVLPVACEGTDCIWPLGWFRPLKVTIGDFIYPEDLNTDKTGSARLEEFSNSIMEKIHNLKTK